MRLRLGVLIFLLFLRLILAGLARPSCPRGSLVSVQGNIDKLIQTESERIIYIDQFRLHYVGESRLKVGDELAVIGSCDAEVLDFWLGQTKLSMAQIVSLQSAVPQPKSRTWSQWQENLAATYQRQLPEPQAGLVAGMVLGLKTNLAPQFYQQLINTGTIHVVVASGYNLSLIAIFLSSVMWWFLPRRQATVVTILLLGVYAMLTGAEAPIVRALVMLSLVLSLPLLGRRLPGWYVFILALWLIMLVDPAIITSISFQLSVAATAGLVWVRPLLARTVRYQSSSFVAAFGDDLASTLAAQATTAPLIFWYFGRLSWISPLANVLISPLIGPLTILGILSQVEALILPYGGIVALITLILSTAVVGLIKFCALLT